MYKSADRCQYGISSSQHIFYTFVQSIHLTKRGGDVYRSHESSCSIDTHGDPLERPVTQQADVAIHCGDLTERSKLEEFRAAIDLLKGLHVPLKLVIGGNHDFALEDASYEAYMREAECNNIEADLVASTFGTLSEARSLLEFNDASAAGIVYLTEGAHHFYLQNGAALTVYASPYRPSRKGIGSNYGPEHEDHDWSIGSDVDVAITHGPPHGVLDRTEDGRAGSASLFAAIARTKPKLHCFGHIHEAWGARKVTWREDMPGELSHFTAINNEESTTITSLAALQRGRFDSEEEAALKQAERIRCEQRGYFDVDASLRAGEQTLFVNAAIEPLKEREPQQLPFLFYLDLPKSAAAGATGSKA